MDQQSLVNQLGTNLTELIDFQVTHSSHSQPSNTPAHVLAGAHTTLVNNVTTSLQTLIESRIESLARPEVRDSNFPQPTPLQIQTAPGPGPSHGHQSDHTHIHQPRPIHPPASLLEPSPMSLDPPRAYLSNSSNSDSESSSRGDVDMPGLSDEDIPSPNPMFDMPDSSDESSPEDPTISDPNHPNYRPLFTYEPLDRIGDGSFEIIPPRRAEPPSPDRAPETP